MKNRYTVNLDEALAPFVGLLSTKAGRARAGQHDRRGSLSVYLERLIRDAEMEWRRAAAFLAARGYTEDLATAAEALQAIEEPVPARMAIDLRQVDLYALAEDVTRDPQTAGAVFVLAREWGRGNPQLQDALARVAEAA